MSAIQSTLGGGETEDGFESPGTFRFCEHCQEEVLRSSFPLEHWDHHIAAELDIEKGDRGYDPDDSGPSYSSNDGDDDVMKVGGKYRVDISYSMDFSFTIVAGTEDRAKEKAKEQVDYGNAWDAHCVHSDIKELEEYYEDDPEADEHDLGW